MGGNTSTPAPDPSPENPINAREFVGLSVNEAERRAQAQGYSVRVIWLHTKAVTADYDLGRVNLSVNSHGVVASAYVG